jgi:hypothetical protein
MLPLQARRLHSFSQIQYRIYKLGGFIVSGAGQSHVSLLCRTPWHLRLWAYGSQDFSRVGGRLSSAFGSHLWPCLSRGHWSSLALAFEQGSAALQNAWTKTWVNRKPSKVTPLFFISFCLRCAGGLLFRTIFTGPPARIPNNVLDCYLDRPLKKTVDLRALIYWTIYCTLNILNVNNQTILEVVLVQTVLLYCFALCFDWLVRSWNFLPVFFLKHHSVFVVVEFLIIGFGRHDFHLNM